jgi:3-dehydroquinate synthase
MSDIQSVHINLAERSYDIRLGTGMLSESGRIVLELVPGVTHAVVITDENVRRPHGEAVAAALAEADVRIDMIVVEPGEASKSIGVAEGLWNGLLELGADRKSLVVAVGGGVVGDLAGLIAATYARGVRFFQIPTSLLAQVDSSVGGKVGVNLPGAKNMVGAFLQPAGVLIDTATLDTLAEREYRSGLAEVVKYGVILDAEFFDYLESHVEGLNNRDPAVLVPTVARCCRLKADVVEQDEREESGLRAVLNYGHTFAHAYETLSGYGELLHGEAVAIGMVNAARLAERLGRIEGDLARRQEALLRALNLPVDTPKLDHDEILRVMQRDKKVQHGRLRFVLPDRIGHVVLVGDVPEDAVRVAL